MPKHLNRPYNTQINTAAEAAGIKVYVYRTAQCSCTDNPAHPKPGCKACGGFGYATIVGTMRPFMGAWADADAAVNKQWRAEGIMRVEDTSFSAPPAMHLYDDYSLLHIASREGEYYEGDVLTRTANLVDVLSFHAIRITNVIQFDPTVANSERRFKQGVDFVVDGTHRGIRWLGTNAPQVGTRYTVQYRVRYDWVLLPGLVMKKQGNSPSGFRYLLRKKHLIMDEMLAAQRKAADRHLDDKQRIPTAPESDNPYRVNRGT